MVGSYVIIFMFCTVTLLKMCYNLSNTKKQRRFYGMNDGKLEILLRQQDDLRDELKQRIAQRDTLSIQCVIAITAVISLAVTTKKELLFMLLPFVMIFFTSQIYESYRVHERLVEFLRENIEKQISINVSLEAEQSLWENYCARVRDLTVDHAVGGRKKFFTYTMLCMPVIACILQFMQLNGTPSKLYIAFVCIYYVVCLHLSVLLNVKDSRALRYQGLNKLAYCDYLKKEDRTDEKTKAIFFDKDGTLHEDKVMTHRWRDLVLLPGAKEIVRYAHEKGYLVIIVTNQSAIGKGIYSVSTMHRFIWLLRKKLKWVDAVYYCPHKFGVECNCRKPKTGMFERAVKELNVSLEDSIMVGDRESDVIAGKNAGVGRNILITTGLYESDTSKLQDFEIVQSLDEINFQ